MPLVVAILFCIIRFAYIPFLVLIFPVDGLYIFPKDVFMVIIPFFKHINLVGIQFD